MDHGFTLTDTNTLDATQEKIFERATKQFGFVPNIVNAFSQSPVLANAMLDLYARMGETSFDPVESHIVLQTINVHNRCTYCVPAHSTVARSQGVSAEIDDSLRQNESLENPKHEALRVFASQMVIERGHVSEDQVNAFLDAGYTRKHILDIVYLNTVKTLTNYGNHIAGTDLDDAFKPLEWAPDEAKIPALA